jgi:hypothetical protein
MYVLRDAFTNFKIAPVVFFLDLRKVDKATLCLQVGGQRPKEKERVGVELERN